MSQREEERWGSLSLLYLIILSFKSSLEPFILQLPPPPPKKTLSTSNQPDMPALCSSVPPLFRWTQHPCLLFFNPFFPSTSLFFNISPTLLQTQILPYKGGIWNWFSKPGYSPFLQSLQCCLSFPTFLGTRMAKIESLLGNWMRRSGAGKDHVFSDGS